MRTDCSKMGEDSLNRAAKMRNAITASNNCLVLAALVVPVSLPGIGMQHLQKALSQRQSEAWRQWQALSRMSFCSAIAIATIAKDFWKYVSTLPNSIRGTRGELFLQQTSPQERPGVGSIIENRCSNLSARNHLVVAQSNRNGSNKPLERGRGRGGFPQLLGYSDWLRHADGRLRRRRCQRKARRAPRDIRVQGWFGLNRSVGAAFRV
jgi:hypothetical protein